MSFVGGKSTLGPRGRGVRQSSSYVADDAAFSSGPGAIAAIDGSTGRRRQLRALANVASARRDRALARMTMGAVPPSMSFTKQLFGAPPPKFTMPGLSIGSPMRPGTITNPLQKYPGMVTRPMIAMPGTGLATGRFGVGAGVPISTTQPGVTPGTGPGGVTVGAGFTTDPSGSTCLTTSLMANGFCPLVPSALPPPTTTTTSGGTGVPASSGGGGGGGGTYSDGSGGGGGPAPPPDDGSGGSAAPPDGQPIDTTALDTSTPAQAAPPAGPVSASTMASLTSNKPLMYGLAAVAAWWLFFRK